MSLAALMLSSSCVLIPIEVQLIRLVSLRVPTNKGDSTLDFTLHTYILTYPSVLPDGSLCDSRFGQIARVVKVCAEIVVYQPTSDTCLGSFIRLRLFLVGAVL